MGLALIVAAHAERGDRLGRSVGANCSSGITGELSGLGVAADRSIRTPASGGGSLTTQRQPQLIEQAKERRLPAVPRQQAIDDPPPAANDLGRHLDHGAAERREVHPQQLAFLRGAAFLPAARLGQQERRPGLEAPRQAGHRHVRPVARQVVERRRQRTNAPLVLLNEILLIAAVVGVEDDLLGRRVPVVGDVKEAPRIVEQLLLTLGRFEVFPHHDHAIRLPAQRRRVRELGHVLLHQADVLELARLDDLLFDVLRPGAGRGFHGVLGRTTKLPPRGFREILGPFVQVRQGVDPEHEPHVPLLVPAVEVRRLGEVGVPAEPQLPKPGLTADRDRLVKILRRPFVAGTIAAAVDHVQRLARIGQRDQQRVVAPLAFVVNIHPLLALARRLDQRAVGLDHGFVEESFRLLPPDFDARLVEHFLQEVDVGRGEPPAEVAGRGRIGNPPRAERIEVNLVGAAQFEMFEARPAGQQVVGDVQHVIRLVVRQVELQQVQAVVDRRGQSQLLHHQMQRSEAAGRDGPRAVGDLIVDVRGRQHRPFGAGVVVLVQTKFDAALAVCELLSYLSVHSKTLRAA